MTISCRFKLRNIIATVHESELLLCIHFVFGAGCSETFKVELLVGKSKKFLLFDFPMRNTILHEFNPSYSTHF